MIVFIIHFFQKKKLPPGIINPFDIAGSSPNINSIFTPPRPLNIKKEKVDINVTIENINDILDLIKKYPPKWDVEYNINIQSLHNIKAPLIRLDNMIGMKNLICSDIDEYITIAVFYRKNTNEFKKLKKNFSQNKIDSFFNSENYTKNLEKIYKELLLK